MANTLSTNLHHQHQHQIQRWANYPVIRDYKAQSYYRVTAELQLSLSRWRVLQFHFLPALMLPIRLNYTVSFPLGNYGGIIMTNETTNYN